MLSAALFIVSVVFLTWQLVRRQRDLKRRHGVSLPPGPKPEILLGNARHIPKDMHWKVFAEWKETYGDIVHLETFGRHIIALNTYDIVREMLDKNAAVYSSRPSHPMGLLCGFDTGIGFAPYGQAWRDRRKLVHQTTSKANMISFQPGIENWMYILLNRILEEPKEWKNHMRLSIGSMILTSAYGIRPKSIDDPYLVSAERTIQAIGKTMFGTYIVDFLPFLRHVPIPIFPFQRDAKVWRAHRMHALNAPFNHVREGMAAGNNIVSIAVTLMDKYPNEHVRDACGALYAAGTDTSMMALKSMLWSMVLFPDVQKKAQEELDRVLVNTLGEATRLPRFNDRPSLPYIEAVLKESTRWHVAAPVGIPHSSLEDNIMRGYFIPKDSIIMPNIWAISRDSQFYPNPDEFKPERYLGPNPAMDPYNFIFGFGRRICVGQHYADSTVFIAIASILSAFNILPPLGPDGKEKHLVTPDAHAGLLLPSEFDVRLEPRSEEFAALIRAAGEEMEEL